MPKKINKTKKLKTKVKKYNKSIFQGKKIEQELKEYKDKNIRLLAEFNNYKKRIFEEKTHRERYEGSEIIKNFIPIIDDIDRVLNLETIKEKAVIDGINLIKNKFLSILNEQGVVSYDSLGEEFNADLHEAIMMKKVKNKSNIIVEEFQKGYKYHDKVIRHSKVVVSE